MNRHYVTVGVPGGEYATAAKDSKEAALRLGNRLWQDGYKEHYRLAHEADEQRAYALSFRIAPPELAEWLERTPPCDNCWQVWGGWVLYAKNEVKGGPLVGVFTTGAVFVPVALASGITVVE
jgi:hypothetical protein